MSNITNEKDLVLSLQACVVVDEQTKALELFVQVANVYIERGLTQEAADILAYILKLEDVPNDIIDSAEELWDDLARWICPRVLLDAETFGRKAFFQDVVDYILAGV